MPSHTSPQRYTVVLWNSVPRDWVDPVGWPARVLKDIEQQEWTVVVLHDVLLKALALLPSFLDEVSARGVEVVADFPEECIPIRKGVIRTDLAALTSL
jgi:peptidoglycan-N-acetylglucosamine deacetylase